MPPAIRGRKPISSVHACPRFVRWERGGSITLKGGGWGGGEAVVVCFPWPWSEGGPFIMTWERSVKLRSCQVVTKFSCAYQTPGMPGGIWINPFDELLVLSLECYPSSQVHHHHPLTRTFNFYWLLNTFKPGYIAWEKCVRVCALGCHNKKNVLVV